MKSLRHTAALAEERGSTMAFAGERRPRGRHRHLTLYLALGAASMAPVIGSLAFGQAPSRADDGGDGGSCITATATPTDTATDTATATVTDTAMATETATATDT